MRTSHCGLQEEAHLAETKLLLLNRLDSPLGINRVQNGTHRVPKGNLRKSKKINMFIDTGLGIHL